MHLNFYYVSTLIVDQPVDIHMFHEYCIFETNTLFKRNLGKSNVVVFSLFFLVAQLVLN